MGFIEKLGLRAREADSWVCVGLDPVIEKIPGSVGTGAGAVAPFLSEIISATSEAACAFKVNLAFFESSGIEGWQIRVAVERPSGVGEARVQVRAYPRQVLGRLVDERHHCGE